MSFSGFHVCRGTYTYITYTCIQIRTGHIYMQINKQKTKDLKNRKKMIAYVVMWIDKSQLYKGQCCVNSLWEVPREAKYIETGSRMEVARG